MNRIVSLLMLCCLWAGAVPSTHASDYVIDTEGGHAFIQFRISHLGYSWLSGRFNHFSGSFSYDEKAPSAATVEVDIETASIDTNHAERDKHLRGEDYLDVARFPQARFVSTDYKESGEGALLTGELTLHGVTRPIEIEVKPVGAGMDPWGGYRRGFEGTTRIRLADFGITKFLGDAAREMEFSLGIEGIRKQDAPKLGRPGGLRIQ
jgi:polyisoprenoid-binding protein YceI